MKKLLFILAAVLASSILAENLIPNPQFISSQKNIPDQWQVGDRFPLANRNIIPGEGGMNIFEISDDATVYSYALTVSVTLDSYKSYEFSIEQKTENVNNAAIYYYWLDPNNKASKEKFISKTSGNSDWQTIKCTLTAADAENTKGIRICLAVYPDKNGVVKGKVFFRNPQLKVISAEAAQAAVKAPPKKQAPQELSVLSFPGRLTAKPALVELNAGRGEVEFLDLTTNHNYQGDLRVYVTMPEDVATEFYMMKNNQGACLQVKPESESRNAGNIERKYSLDKSWNFHALGNGILFKTEDATAEKFDIQVRITNAEGKELVRMTAPIRLIPSVTADCSNMSGFESYSWYLYPIQRIDTAAPANKLAAELKERWVKSGFSMKKASPLHAFPFTMSRYIDKDSPGLYAALEVGGGKSQLTCPTVAARAGTAAVVEWFKKKNMVQNFAAPNYWGIFDYEPYCFSWTTGSCFCPDCRQEFMKSIKLDGATLEPKEILGKHQKQWTQFVCRQRAEVMRMIFAAIKQVNPQATNSFCSMPQPGYDENQDLYYQEYGIDARLYDDFTDTHCPMNYDTSLRFFTRLETTQQQVTKPHIPILSTGWGPQTNFHPERYRLHVMAAGLLGCPAVYTYRGLMGMHGDWQNAHRNALLALGKLNQYRQLANIYHPQKEQYYREAYAAKDNLYVIAKKQHDDIALFLFNNHQYETIYATLTPSGNLKSLRNLLDDTLFSPDGTRKTYTTEELKNGVMVRIPPLTMLPLEFSSREFASALIVVNTGETAKQEAGLQQTARNLFKPHKQNGMSTGLKTVDGKTYFTLTTPAQELQVDLGTGATARWFANNKPVVDKLGNDCLIAPSTLWLNTQPAELAGTDFTADGVSATFRFKLNDMPYTGLTVEKIYRILRDKPIIEVKVNVLPHGGYRQFTYRANLVLGIGKSTVEPPYSASIGYLVPQQGKLQNTQQTGFAKEGAKTHLSKDTGKWDGSYWLAANRVSGEQLRADIGERPVELYSWLKNNTATMEWVYPDAYPDNDPHKVADWSASYTLEYKEKP